MPSAEQVAYQHPDEHQRRKERRVGYQSQGTLRGGKGHIENGPARLHKPEALDPALLALLGFCYGAHTKR